MNEKEMLVEMKDSIASAVATLDEADGSRAGTSAAIDGAREILAAAYGVGFERAVSSHLGLDNDSDEVDEDEDEDDFE